MPHVLFETERLIARRIVPDDLGAMLAVYGDPVGMRYVGDGSPADREECERWIGVTLENYRTRGYGMSALVERSSGETVGFCGLVHPGGQAEAEIKYALRRERWGEGLAGEAAAAMLRHGLEVHGIRRVIATLDPEHVVSRRLLERCGLVPETTRMGDDGLPALVMVWNAPAIP